MRVVITVVSSCGDYFVPKVSPKAIGETAELCVEGCRPLVDIPGTAYMHL